MTSTPQPLSSGTGLDRVFATLRRSPVTRAPEHVIAGVCSGLALKLGVSVKVVRILAVVAALLGPALVLYLAAWLLLPDSQGRVQLEQALRGGRTSSIVLLVATLLVLVPDAAFRARVGWLVPLVVVGALGWFLWSRRQRGTDTGASQPTPSAWTAPEATPPQTPLQTPSLLKHPQGPQDQPHA